MNVYFHVKSDNKVCVSDARIHTRPLTEAEIEGGWYTVAEVEDVKDQWEVLALMVVGVAEHLFSLLDAEGLHAPLREAIEQYTKMMNAAVALVDPDSDLAVEKRRA